MGKMDDKQEQALSVLPYTKLTRKQPSLYPETAPNTVYAACRRPNKSEYVDGVGPTGPSM